MNLRYDYFLFCSLIITINSTFSLQETFPQKIKERKIVVVIPSYNNPLEITRECLNSVLIQDYQNFEIIFSDDCSPQPIIEQKHKALIKELDKNNKITYQRNHERYGPIGNQWHAFHTINPDNIDDNREIIVATLDGDDLFLDSNVLQIVNELHQKAWVTYGNFAYYPSMQTDCCCYEVSKDIIKANRWRKVPGFPTTHLRTARLSLIKNLPLESFLYNGIFYPAAGDTMIMYALCEQAGNRAIFNPKRVYGYRITEQAENKVMPQIHQDCAQFTRKQKPFEPLKELPFQKPIESYTCDLVIFSYKRPMQLYALLESLQEYVTGLHHITVLYRTDDDRYEQAYSSVKNSFDSVLFIRQSNKPSKDFQSLFLQCLKKSISEYIMFATDDDIVLTQISIQDCIRALQKTHAYGFYLRLGKNLTRSYMANAHQPLPNFIPIDLSISAWQIDPSHDQRLFDWAYPNTVDMTMYPKNKIVTTLEDLCFNNPTSLEGNWTQLANSESSKIGLCFEQSKIVNIPANRVQDVSLINRNMEHDPQELLELFEQGFKIDRKSFHQWQNCSAHEEYELKFTQR